MSVTAAPQMESNPLQRALDNYLVMEQQCAAARHEAAEARADNGRLVAEVNMLRDQLASTEADRRKWQVACSTLIGRLLSINDVIASAMKQAARDGLKAMDEPEGTGAERAAGTQAVGAVANAEVAEKNEAPPEPPQRVLAAVPRNQMEFRR